MNNPCNSPKRTNKQKMEEAYQYLCNASSYLGVAAEVVREAGDKASADKIKQAEVETILVLQSIFDRLGVEKG